MNAWITDFQRTAVGKLGGKLSGARPDDMAASTIRSLIERNSREEPLQLEDVVLGCANQAGEDNRNIARFAALLAGLPVEVPGTTVNRLCASGMQSVIDAAARIRSGMNELLIAGGVESMSRAPYVMRKPSIPFDRNPELVDTTLGWRFVNPAFLEMYHPFSMGETAENIADRWGINREDQDDFAFRSHFRYAQALERSVFEDELIPDPLDADAVRDEQVRIRPSREKMAALLPVFRENGSVTAANASGLNDGAAALLIAGDDAAERFGLNRLAKITDAAVVGVHPDIMGTGPVPAIQALLKRNKLSVSDVGLFEINEAYAVQVIYAIRELGLNEERLNVNGGALAIGHPLGMSGARITGHLALEMNRRGVRYGVASMCVGVGQGVAILLENNNL